VLDFSTVPGVKNLNFIRVAPYARGMNLRASAYATILRISVVDVARELGVTRRFVLKECQAGRLERGEDGAVTGAALARYLERSRLQA